MGLLKSPLIILLIFTILYTSAASHRSFIMSRIRNANASNNCFCFPKSIAQAPIGNIIDPNNNGLERLIVYFYRDLGSRVIKMYIPAKEKQNLIPDIPFETGDTLDSITTETITEVFNSNLNIVNVTDVPKQDKQSEIDAETHESGTNENVDAESVPVAVSPLDVSNLFPIDEMLTHHPIPSDFEEISEAWSLIDDHNLPYNTFIGDSNALLPNDPQPSVKPSILNSTIFNYNRNSKNYITFDKWFADQMAKFNALNGPTSANTIDVYTLKSLTEKTLQENNIYVSINGVLTDAHGTVIDFSNLMLRPILIGDLLAYQNVLKETNKFKIPTNSPYLEALLITLVNPPKVLGIIPLGLAVLPSQFSSSSLPIMQTIPNDKNSYEISSAGNSYSTQRKFGNYGGRRILPGYLKVPNNGQNSIDMGHSTISNRQVPRKRLDGILQKTKTNKLVKDYIARKAVKGPVENVEDSDDLQKVKRFKLRKILKNFYRLLMGAKQEGKDHIDDFDSYEDIIDEDVEEKHNFRIIGGNAATSSGTPLSNKGRSGLIV